VTSISLIELLAKFVPTSYPQPWSWEDEEREILTRPCLCCGRPGHYQQQLEAHLREFGLSDGICIEGDRVTDGHHRIVAARRLSITEIPIESAEAAHARWLRDHGPIDWVDRKVGDRLSWEQEWQHQRSRGDFGRLRCPHPTRATVRQPYRIKVCAHCGGAGIVYEKAASW